MDDGTKTKQLKEKEDAENARKLEIMRKAR